MNVIKFQDKNELALEQYNLENVRSFALKFGNKKLPSKCIIPIPLRLNVLITHRCQWGCPGCRSANTDMNNMEIDALEEKIDYSKIYSNEYQNEKPFKQSVEKRCNFLQDVLSKLSLFRNIIEIDINGGEPGLQLDRIEQNIKIIQDNGFKISSYFTNGTNIINEYDNFEPVIQMLNRYGIKANINLNVPHYNEESRLKIFQYQLSNGPYDGNIDFEHLPITNKEIKKLARFCNINNIDLKLTAIMYYGLSCYPSLFTKNKYIDYEYINTADKIIKYVDIFKDMGVSKFIFRQYGEYKYKTKRGISVYDYIHPYSVKRTIDDIKVLYDIKHIEKLKNNFTTVNVFDFPSRDMVIKTYYNSLATYTNKNAFINVLSAFSDFYSNEVLNKIEFLDFIKKLKNNVKGVNI